MFMRPPWYGVQALAALSPAAFSFDSDAAAYFAAVVTAGGADLDATHKTAINTYIVGLKAAGIWTKIDRRILFANQHATAALICIKSLIAATLVNTPTFAADAGYTTSSGHALTPTYDPAVDAVVLSRNSNHMMHYIRTNRTTSDAMHSMGMVIGSVCFFLAANYQLTTYMSDLVNPLDSGVASTTARGMWCMNRSASNAVQYYKNGASIGTSTTASQAVPSGFIAIGGLNFEGAITEQCTDQFAVVGLGASLTAGEVADDVTLTEACLDAIGAGVL